MSDSADEITDFSKMKVAELKKELKSRNLSTSGNKTELLERLQSALVGDGLDDTVLGDGELDDDEDDDEDVLNDVELDDEKSLDLYSTVHEDALISPPGLKRSISGTSLDSAPPPKKIILDRSVALLPTVTKPVTDSEPTEPSKRKVITFNSLNDKERLELRAKKFGIVDAKTTETKTSDTKSADIKTADTKSADAKRDARAERFGVVTAKPETKSLSKNKVDTSLDVLKKRAERFGSTVSKKLVEVEDKEKLEQRKARFISLTPPATAVAAAVNTSSTVVPAIIKTGNTLSNEEKAKLRLERFKPSVK